MIPIAMAMDDANRRRMAGLPIMREEDVLRGVITTCARHDLWSETLPLVDALPDAAKPILAQCIGDVTTEQLLSAVKTAAVSDNIPVLVDIALAQDVAGRQRILDIIDGMDDLDEFVAALTSETPAEVWTALVELRDEIPEKLRALLADRAQTCGQEDCAAGLRTTAG